MFPSLLSFKDASLAVAGAGLVTHAVFKRTETHVPLYVSLLLLGVPTLLTLLMIPHFSGIIASAATTFSLYWATLSSSILIYRASPWHPLAQYPGPFLCKLSKFWFAFYSMGGKQHLRYAELHDRYGDVVRVGPNELSFRNVEAVAPLMGPAGLPKGPFWEGRIPEQQEIKAMIAIRDKHDHTRRRRPWTRAFNTAALKGYETLIINRTSQLVDGLGSHAGPVDMSKWISFFTYDIMTDLAFGGGSEMMRDGDVDGLWHIIEAGQKIAIFMGHVPWLGSWFLRFPSFAEDLKAFRSYALSRALTRKKQGSKYKDLFHHLIDEEGHSATPPSIPEVISDGGLAILAGADTTSSALANLFFFILHNPTAYKRLQAEIDNMGDDEHDFAQQAHLPYLNATINESLRLFPPVLSGSQRATESGGGGKAVGSHFIPEGTTTFIPFYVIQRDPRYFSPLPNNFIPERWLSPEEQLALEPGVFKDQANVINNNNAFIPFSVGPSNCVGKNFAYMEMRMVVVQIMRRYELRLKDGYKEGEWAEKMLDFFVMLKGELPVILTPRK